MIHERICCRKEWREVQLVCYCGEDLTVEGWVHVVGKGQEWQDQYKRVFKLCRWWQPNSYQTRWFKVPHHWLVNHNRWCLSLPGVHNWFRSHWRCLKNVLQDFATMLREGCHFGGSSQLHLWESFCIRIKYGWQKSKDIRNGGIHFKLWRRTCTFGRRDSRVPRQSDFFFASSISNGNVSLHCMI